MSCHLQGVQPHILRCSDAYAAPSAFSKLAAVLSSRLESQHGSAAAAIAPPPVDAGFTRQLQLLHACREAEMDDVAVAAARRTCRAWRRMVGVCLRGTLIPASFQTARHLAAFPTITVVDLRDVSTVATN